MRMRRRSGASLVLVCLAVVVSSTVTSCVTDPEVLHTQTFELPAFNFAPVGEEGDESNSFRRGIPRPAGDIAVKRITWKLVDGAGQEIPATNHDIHVHHVVLFNNGHDDKACPSSSSLGGRWAAPGGERTPFELPAGYGYFTDRDDDWSATWHIMNLSDRPQQNLRMQYTVTWAEERSTMVGVTPYWFDQAGCYSAGTITVPGGGDPAVYTRQRSFTVRESGVIRAVRSHMHGGGLGLTLTRADGTVVCEATPVYHEPEGGGGHEHGGTDEHGHGGSSARIISIPLCSNLDVRVTKGERLTSTVRYRNDVRQTDAMASNLLWIAEDPKPPGQTTTVTTVTTSPAPLN